MLNLQNDNFSIIVYRQEAVEAFVNILKDYYKNVYNNHIFVCDEIVCAYNDKGFYTVSYRVEEVILCFYSYDKLKDLNIGSGINDIIIYLYDHNIHGKLRNDWYVIYNEKEKDRWWCKLQHENMKNVFNGMKIVIGKYRELINKRIEFYLGIINYNRNLEMNKICEKRIWIMKEQETSV